MRTSLLVVSWATWSVLAVANQFEPEPDAGASPSLDALRACDGSPHGSSCSFSLDDGEARGTCVPPIPEAPAACIPSVVMTRVE